MFSSSLRDAMTEATPANLAALNSQGVFALVAVENGKGEWFVLHADNVLHGEGLACHWVNQMGARGCSVWSILNGAIGRKPNFTVFEDHSWEDAA
jgi:hypothetical protein